MIAVKSSAPKKSAIEKSERIIAAPLFSSMLRFALPLLLANMISTMFNAVDVMVLSWFSVGNEVAALGATSAVNALFSQFCLGLCVGVNIILSRLLGRGDTEQAKRVISTAILTGVLLGALMAALGISINRPFLQWTDCPAECFEDASLYSALYFAGLPFVLVYYYAASVIRVSGDSKSPLLFMIISGISNVLLNTLFCLILPRKVAAVALATLVSQAIGAFLALRHLAKSNGPCHFDIKKLQFDFASFKKMLWYGLPSAITFSVFPITNLQIQTEMNAFGAEALTGNVSVMQYENIIGNIGSAFNTTALTYMGHNIGAKNKTRVYKSFFYMAAVEFFSVLITSSVVLAFGKYFAAIFGAGSGAALNAALLRMRVVLLFYFIPLTPMPSAIQAFGYPTAQTAVQMIGTLGLRTLWMQAIYGKLIEKSLFNIYICYPVSYSIVALVYAAIVTVLFVRYKKDKLGDKL